MSQMEMLKSKSCKVLKKILDERRVDYSVCVEKNDLIKLILKTRALTPNQKSQESQIVENNDFAGNASDYKRALPAKTANVIQQSVDMPGQAHNDIIDQFKRMGLTSQEAPNIINCQTFLKRNPECSAQWYNLGVYLAEEHRMEASKQCYQNSVKYEPGFKLPHNNLGAYFKDHGDLNQAVYHYQKALESDPDFAIALSNLAITHFAMGNLGDAQRHCRRAIELEPDKAEAHNNLGTLVLHAGCCADEAIPHFEKCIELDPLASAGSFAAYSNRLLASTSTPAPCEDKLTGDEKDVYNEKIWNYHHDWAVMFEKMHADVQFKEWHNDLNPKRAIRVGYLSTDLRGHPVSYFAEAALKFMDFSKVEIYVYLNGPPGDKRTAVIRTEIPDERWRMLGNRSPLECAELIRSDEIDILVELGGHAAGNRQDIMVLRAAPIQATWIGYANTTGLSCVDYRITDSIADPLDTHQGFSEKLVHMPDPCAFLCYTGTQHSPLCTGAPAKKNGYLTFGSFNALHKLTLQGLDLWCRVLTAVPTSRLFLKCKPFKCPTIKQKYRKLFKERGISMGRVTLMTHVSSREEHMELYTNIDIALDPFPYSGTTTSAEALWMGVPIITLNRVKFPIHAQNVTTSLQSRIPGLKQFIAKTKQEYVDRAVYWSNNINKLDKIKATLRQTMMESPFCNGPLFCEKLTEVYRKMWVDHCQKMME